MNHLNVAPLYQLSEQRCSFGKIHLHFGLFSEGNSIENSFSRAAEVVVSLRAAPSSYLLIIQHLSGHWAAFKAHIH